MKKKILSVVLVGGLAFCGMSGTQINSYAAELDVSNTENYTEEAYGLLEEDLNGMDLDEQKERGIFTTKYRVSVSRVTMRSGPGTNYSSLGTLYKNDIVWVRSISGGWAKFKVNSRWHYVPSNSIKKSTY